MMSSLQVVEFSKFIHRIFSWKLGSFNIKSNWFVGAGAGAIDPNGLMSRDFTSPFYELT